MSTYSPHMSTTDLYQQNPSSSYYTNIPDYPPLQEIGQSSIIYSENNFTAKNNVRKRNHIRNNPNMGYISIEHLYKSPDFFQIKDEIVYMEKIHGTSAWIAMNITETGTNINYHPGGETSKTFEALFDKNFIE